MAKAPSPEDLQWMKEHINDTRVPGIIASAVVCTVASFVILAVRIWARRQTRRNLVASDWFFVLSVVTLLSYDISYGMLAKYGGGRMVITITDPDDLRNLAILNIISPITYAFAAGFVKWSILALYLAIFPQKLFRVWVYFLAVINGLNSFPITILVSCLQCIPLKALWDPSVTDAKCINFSYFSVFNAAFTFALDVAILLTPLPLVFHLKLSQKKKILLALNFALGGSACIVAAIRLPYARKVGGTDNPSWDMVPGAELCAVEVVVAQLCASLPVYRPLFKRIATRLGTTYDSTNGQSNRDSRTGGVHPGYLNGTDRLHMASISTNNQSRPARRGINVTDDVSMTRHTQVNGQWVRVSDDDDDMKAILKNAELEDSRSSSQTSVSKDQPNAI